MSYRTAIFGAVVGLVGVLPGTSARPPDKIVLLRSGQARYVRTLQGSWDAVSLDPAVVRVRYDGAGEVYLEAVAEGETMVVLDNRKISRFHVWKVLVGDGPTVRKADTSMVERACRCEREPDEPLRCVVTGPGCLDALDVTFERQPVTTADIAVVLTLRSAQQLLRRIHKGVKSEGFDGVDLAFVGANLMVRARVRSVGQRRELLLAVWRHMLGKMVLEDRIEVTGGGGDGGDEIEKIEGG